MHELKHADAGEAEDLQPPASPHPPPARPGDFGPEGNQPAVPRPRRRRGAWAGDGAMPAIEKRRLAAREIRRAYGRIKSDFSEAYEHCRNDAQRRALELAHQAAKQACSCALDERLLEDREAWSMLASGFRPERARAERQLARLLTADALARILKRLAVIESMLGALSA